MVFFRSRGRGKRRIAYLLKLLLNMIHYSLENYAINRLSKDRVDNDLGASHTSIGRRDGGIVKRAAPDGEDKLRDEIEWILRFSKTRLGRYLPEIREHSLEPGNVFYSMKYYNYPNLRKIVAYEMNARFFIRLRLLHLVETLDSELWTAENASACPPDFVRKEYFDKFRARRADAERRDPYFGRFFEAECLSVNGRRVPNARVLLEAIEGDPASMGRLTPPELYVSHGDVHANNILCGFSHRDMILIDCRGRSSAGLPWFDPAYDLAKLFHDFRGMYSLIERHDYAIFHKADPGAEPAVAYEYTDPKVQASFKGHYPFIRAVAHRNLTRFGNILERADFAEPLLFLTMVPLHMRKLDEALMCYITGVMELNAYCHKYRRELYEGVLARLGLEEQR